MDPLSISATVVSLAAKCMQTAKFLHDLHSKFKYAEVTIRAICSESMIIGATLSKIQMLLIEHPEIFTERMQSPSQVQNIFDVVLTGCMVVYSVLDEEIQRFLPDPDDMSQIGFMSRAKFIWDEDVMHNLLRDIRGQQTALSALIQLLQLESIVEMQKQIKKNELTFDNVARSTRRLRSTRGSTRDMMSIYDTTFDTQRRMNRGDVSMISSTEFTFDDLVVNSTVYRRALLAASRDGSQTALPSQEDGPAEELLKSSDSIRTVKQDDRSSTLVEDAITVPTTSSRSTTGSSSSTRTIETQTDARSLSAIFANYNLNPTDRLVNVARYLNDWNRSVKFTEHVAKSGFHEQELLFSIARKYQYFVAASEVSLEQEQLMVSYGEIKAKYAKVKRYYFEVQNGYHQMKTRFESTTAVLNYEWSKAPSLEDSPFPDDERYEVFSIRLRAPGAEHGVVPVTVGKIERVEDFMQRLSDKLQISLAGCSLSSGEQILATDLSMSDIQADQDSSPPLVSIQPIRTITPLIAGTDINAVAGTKAPDAAVVMPFRSNV